MLRTYKTCNFPNGGGVFSHSAISHRRAPQTGSVVTSRSDLTVMRDARGLVVTHKTCVLGYVRFTEHARARAWAVRVWKVRADGGVLQEPILIRGVITLRAPRIATWSRC